MNALEQIDRLIESVRTLVKIPGRVIYTTPEYREFHDTITQFIYENHLDKTEEWEKISDKLVYTPTQYMDIREANMILLCLESIKRILLSEKYEQFWHYIHPKITEITKDRFYNGKYADAIEAAFKEVNVRVKKIVKSINNKELDGATLMEQCFSKDNPLLKFEDNSTTDGQNIQLGYMKIFSGAMIGIRNPKAHSNQIIAREDAIRELHFASILMFKIDKAINYTKHTRITIESY